MDFEDLFHAGITILGFAAMIALCLVLAVIVMGV